MLSMRTLVRLTQILEMQIETTGIFEGWTVSAVLAEAEKALGGCTSQYSLSDLNDALNAINESWVDGQFATHYISF